MPRAQVRDARRGRAAEPQQPRRALLDGRVVWANQKLAKLLGAKDPQELTGLLFDSLITAGPDGAPLGRAIDKEVESIESVACVLPTFKDNVFHRYGVRAFIDATFHAPTGVQFTPPFGEDHC